MLLVVLTLDTNHIFSSAAYIAPTAGGSNLSSAVHHASWQTPCML